MLPLRLPAALQHAQDYFPVLKMGKLSNEVTGPRWLTGSALNPSKPASRLPLCSKGKSFAGVPLPPVLKLGTQSSQLSAPDFPGEGEGGWGGEDSGNCRDRRVPSASQFHWHLSLCLIVLLHHALFSSWVNVDLHHL